MKGNVLVTGGCGFIGSNFITTTLADHKFKGRIVNMDCLTYAGNPDNVGPVADNPRYKFIKGDISDRDAVEEVFKAEEISTVVHFAAESHVDKSITGPAAFVSTNITGTFNLLDAARRHWAGRKNTRFHHVSTDEVYGSLADHGKFLESTPYDPRSPYSASKAASDHLVRAYFHTYGLPVTISNCSNNYGPRQHQEKLLPTIILNAFNRRRIPVYGDGLYIRDWLHVEDHCSAIRTIIAKGRVGNTYNVGGDCEMTNLALIKTVCSIMDRDDAELVEFVKDRPGHDRRYAIDCTKIKVELGWKQSVRLEEGLRQTVEWYCGRDNLAR